MKTIVINTDTPFAMVIRDEEVETVQRLLSGINRNTDLELELKEES